MRVCCARDRGLPQIRASDCWQTVAIERRGVDYRFLVTLASESSSSDEKASVEVSFGRLAPDFGMSKDAESYH